MPFIFNCKHESKSKQTQTEVDTDNNVPEKIISFLVKTPAPPVVFRTCASLPCETLQQYPALLAFAPPELVEIKKNLLDCRDSISIYYNQKEPKIIVPAALCKLFLDFSCDFQNKNESKAQASKAKASKAKAHTTQDTEASPIPNLGQLYSCLTVNDFMHNANIALALVSVREKTQILKKGEQAYFPFINQKPSLPVEVINTQINSLADKTYCTIKTQNGENNHVKSFEYLVHIMYCEEVQGVYALEDLVVFLKIIFVSLFNQGRELYLRCHVQQRSFSCQQIAKKLSSLYLAFVELEHTFFKIKQDRAQLELSQFTSKAKKQINEQLTQICYSLYKSSTFKYVAQLKDIPLTERDEVSSISIEHRPDLDTQHLSKLLPKFSKLRSLSIFDCALNDLSFIEELPCLSELNLRHNQINTLPDVIDAVDLVEQENNKEQDKQALPLVKLKHLNLCENPLQFSELLVLKNLSSLKRLLVDQAQFPLGASLEERQQSTELIINKDCRLTVIDRASLRLDDSQIPKVLFERPATQPSVQSSAQTALQSSDQNSEPKLEAKPKQQSGFFFSSVDINDIAKVSVKSTINQYANDFVEQDIPLSISSKTNPFFYDKFTRTWPGATVKQMLPIYSDQLRLMMQNLMHKRYYEQERFVFYDLRNFLRKKPQALPFSLRFASDKEDKPLVHFCEEDKPFYTCSIFELIRIFSYYFSKLAIVYEQEKEQSDAKMLDSLEAELKSFIDFCCKEAQRFYSKKQEVRLSKTLQSQQTPTQASSNQISYYTKNSLTQVNVKAISDISAQEYDKVATFIIEDYPSFNDFEQLQKFSNLTTLCIRHCAVSHTDLSFVQYMPQLERLTLLNNNIENLDFITKASLPNLRRLYLCVNPLDNAELLKINNLPQLTVLYCDDKQLPSLEQAKAFPTSLEINCLSMIDIGDNEFLVQTFFERKARKRKTTTVTKKKSPALNEVDLRKIYIKNRLLYSAIANELGYLPVITYDLKKVTKLDVSNKIKLVENYLFLKDPQDTQDDFAYLKYATKLKKLNLSSRKLDSFAFLADCPSLESLILAETNFKAQDLVVLRNCKNLRYLDLSSTNFCFNELAEQELVSLNDGQEEASNIVELKQNEGYFSRLAQIDLNYNSNIGSFDFIINHCPNLQALRLENCELIKEEELLKLKELILGTKLAKVDFKYSFEYDFSDDFRHALEHTFKKNIAYDINQDIKSSVKSELISTEDQVISLEYDNSYTSPLVKTIQDRAYILLEEQLGLIRTKFQEELIEKANYRKATLSFLDLKFSSIQTCSKKYYELMLNVPTLILDHKSLREFNDFIVQHFIQNCQQTNFTMSPQDEAVTNISLSEILDSREPYLQVVNFWQANMLPSLYLKLLLKFKTIEYCAPAVSYISTTQLDSVDATTTKTNKISARSNNSVANIYFLTNQSYEYLRQIYGEHARYPWENQDSLEVDVAERVKRCDFSIKKDCSSLLPLLVDARFAEPIYYAYTHNHVVRFKENIEGNKCYSYEVIAPNLNFFLWYFPQSMFIKGIKQKL